MNKKNPELKTVDAFLDRYKILCCECPHCEGFIPNVKSKESEKTVLVKCANCGTSFLARIPDEN